ncbi:VOC family protein [Kovacikia minuta CCNUW1]|uniref:VOC family protein n=1 Tax=Kovacikia minuta TaxID=2931930 RepID=UPI001CCB3AF5|nr:VOC family protein [Kovacikia minuta]UBF24155.1 VOC family protein [Kovacikia minuta CCNUW1]
MQIDRIDHLVLTVADIEATCRFYSQVLGMEIVTFGEGRKALKFGQQKINLHPVEGAFEPKAFRPTVGSTDLCMIVQTNLEDVMRHLAIQGVVIIAGPVIRTGAMGEIESIYIRDPDQNLLEISTYLN